MTIRKKIILCLLAIAGTLLVLALALVLLAPSLLKTEALKGQLQSALLAKTGGELDYQHLELHYFPLPKFELHRASLALPDLLDANIKTLIFYPDLLSLLTGSVRFTRLTLEAPDLSIRLPEQAAQIEPQPPSFSGADFHRRVAALLAPLALHAPEMKLEIRDGKLLLVEKEQPLFSAGDLNLKVEFSANDENSFQADLQGSVPELSIFRGKEKVIISGKSLQGSLRGDPEKFTAQLTELALTQPKLTVAGTFSATRTLPEFVLDLHGENVDVDATRKTALALFGEFPVTQAIFNIVRGGTVPQISFETRGKTAAELGKADHIQIKGRMQQGEIFIPGVDLLLKETSGYVVIAGGILEGKQLSAKLEQSRGEQGELKIGLRGGDAPFHLELMIDADLTLLPPILERVVNHPAFVAELKRITLLKGKGRGKLVLGESLQAVKAKVEVEELHLSGDYQRIPFPVDIQQGQFSFSATQVEVKNLAGTVGASSFADLSYRLHWRDAIILDIVSGRFDLSLDELFPWALSFAKVRELCKEVTDARGRLELSSLKLKGPVKQPAQWQFEAAGELKDLNLQTIFHPDPVHLRGGSFQTDPGRLALQNVQTEVLDATFDLSGIVGGFDSGEVTLSGNVGHEAAEWLRNTLKLKPFWAVHTPLALSKTELKWKPGTTFSIKGDVSFPKGTRATGALFYSPAALSIDKLHIDDNESAATLSLHYQNNALDLEFLGSLQKNIFDDIFVSPQLSNEWLAGDIQASIVLNRPAQSTFQGELTGGNIPIPLKSPEPLLLERVALAARGNRIDINSAALTWGKQKAAINGGVDIAAEGYLLDLDVSTGKLLWDDIDQLLVAERAPARAKSDRQPWELPVSGEVRLSAESFNWRHYTWRPVQAAITIRPEALGIKVNQAQLCGIDTPGSLTADREGLTLEFQPTAKDQNLANSYACLTEGRVNMTGSFDLTGRIKAQGPVDALLNSATGSLAFKAQKGKITRHKLFSRILEVINVTEIYRGKFPSLDRTGFPYDAVIAKGHLKEGKYFLNEFFLDGETMEVVGKGEFDLGSKTMDAKLLVEPLKTVDAIIKKIPGVNYLLGGSLISIPVSAKGDISAPKVTILSPSQIGSGLLNFAERVLKAPLKIIEPMIPATKSE